MIKWSQILILNWNERVSVQDEILPHLFLIHIYNLAPYLTSKSDINSLCTCPPPSHPSGYFRFWLILHWQADDNPVSCLFTSALRSTLFFFFVLFYRLSGTVSVLPHFCVFGGYREAGVSDWCCVKMRKGAPWLNLTLLCDLCGISASGKVGKKEKLGIGWIKGPCKPKKKKKSSCREQDRHGHMEQGGPDSKADPHSSSVDLPPLRLHKSYFTPVFIHPDF